MVALLILALVDLSLAAESFYDLKAVDATGAEVALQQYRGKVRDIISVEIVSLCAHTSLCHRCHWW